LRSSFSVAPGSVSNSADFLMPSRWWKASAWNSLCAPLPISAMRAAVGPGQGARGHGRHGGRAQRGGQRQFADQKGAPGGHVGQHAKRHHGGQANAAVFWGGR
jgi:hypothetical protein